jgi:dTDP-4-amino-4,6-dideoxygalactose transaminase
MPIDLPFTRPSIDAETIAAVGDVLSSGWLATGPRVAEFEKALAVYFSGAPGGGDRIVRVMTSATNALELALLAAGIGPGTEVIVPAMTFVATANVVVRVGARPVFADVDLRSRNLSPKSVARAITARTRAIMPVHFAGLAVDLDAIYGIAQAEGLRVIEDAAHAIGTSYQGRRIGSFGDIVCFSFHPNKNMTTIEGGAVSMGSNPEELLTLELERFHGQVRDAAGHADVLRAGGKSNLSDVSACIGLRQLAQLAHFNARRRQLAEKYFEILVDDALVSLPAKGDEGHSWHMFTVLVDFRRYGLSRQQLLRAMAERGIGIGVHYPSIPSLSFYRQLGYLDEDCPNAAQIGRETITLPLFPDMKDSDVERVCIALGEILKEKEKG